MQVTLTARATAPTARKNASALYAELRELLGLAPVAAGAAPVRLIERPALSEGGVEFTRWTGAQMVLDLPEDVMALMLDNEDGDREMARRTLRTIAVCTRDAAEGIDDPFRLESVEINFSDHRSLPEPAVVRFD